MSELLAPVPGQIIQATHADGRIFRRGKAWPEMTSQGVKFTDAVLVEHLEVVGDDGRPNEPDKLVVRGLPNVSKNPGGKGLRFECYTHPFVTGILFEDLPENLVEEINEARAAEAAGDAPPAAPAGSEVP